MSWLELDDGILDHPKFIRAVKLAGGDAVFLWLGLRAHCAKLLTDGLIQSDMIDEVRGPKDPKKRAAALKALFEARLLDEDPEGVRMHNYLKWSKSRAQVLAQREAARARQTKFRGGHANVADVGNGTRNGVTVTVTDADVSRSTGEEWSGVGGGSGSSDQATTGSTPPDNARGDDLRTRSSLWLKDPQKASLTFPSPERWAETRLIVGTLTEVFGGAEQEIRGSRDPRMQVLFERWADGHRTDDLVAAIRGAGKDDLVRSKPQLQNLKTILRDSGEVDRYARLLTVAPVVELKPHRGAQQPKQPNSGYKPPMEEEA